MMSIVLQKHEFEKRDQSMLQHFLSFFDNQNPKAGTQKECFKPKLRQIEKKRLMDTLV